VEARHRTYLTIGLVRHVESNEFRDYSHERGEARKGVNLPKRQGESQPEAHSEGTRRRCPSKKSPSNLNTTYPYRPSVAYTSFDDVPLIVKIRGKLPSGIIVDSRESVSRSTNRNKSARDARKSECNLTCKDHPTRG
jgi:hypothetical protein